jgi:hypothetical protein
MLLRGWVVAVVLEQPVVTLALFLYGGILQHVNEWPASKVERRASLIPSSMGRRVSRPISQPRGFLCIRDREASCYQNLRQELLAHEAFMGKA